MQVCRVPVAGYAVALPPCQQPCTGLSLVCTAAGLDWFGELPLVSTACPRVAAHVHTPRLNCHTRPLRPSPAPPGRCSDTDIAKLMGRVFLEQSQLNLLGSVLDTPDFFWEAGVPDSMQNIYDRVRS